MIYIRWQLEIKLNYQKCNLCSKIINTINQTLITKNVILENGTYYRTAICAIPLALEISK